MEKRLFAVAAVLALIAGALFAQGRDKISLAIGYIPHVQFTPLYVGIEKGYYRDEGVDLEISYGFGIDIFSLLQAGKIDLGLSDSDQLIISGAKDLGLQAVFQYYQKYPVSIVAAAGAIKSPEELAGKMIGTPELYGTSYIGLQLFLRKYGLAGRVDVERIGYTQAATLRSGKVAAVVCFSNNEPILLRLDGVAITQWDVRDFSDMVGASFISSRDIISRKGDALRRFARATGRAMAFTEANTDEAFAIALKQIGNLKKDDEPFFRKVLDATCQLFPSPKGYGYIDADTYQRSIEELVSLGLIKERYGAQKIIHPLGG
jgi:NitT/TauT family transport system substrate-binding protein